MSKNFLIQESIERSVGLSCSLQDMLAFHTEACSAGYKEDHQKNIKHAEEQCHYSEKLSISHSASKVATLISNLMPWGAFGKTKISPTGMFGLLCAAGGSFFEIQSKKKVNRCTWNWQFKTARIMEIASFCFCLKGFLIGPMNLATQTFTVAMSIGQSALSIYSERCQRKITKIELERDRVQLRQDQRTSSLKLLAKTFSSSMNSDGSALGLIRQASMLQENSLDEILKRQ